MPLDAPVLRCGGCGAEVPLDNRLVWECPRRRCVDDVDHVLVPALGRTGLCLPPTGADNPFLRYRSLLASYQRWLSGGGSDGGFVELAEELDEAVAQIDGGGFRTTPLVSAPALRAGLWVKDETGNVAGSHKGRHLMGVMLHLLVADRLGSGAAGPLDAPLAVASCGNAALAAAVVARAARRRLAIYVPTDADPGVCERLRLLGAEVTVCARHRDESGDPCYLRFRQAVAAGAVPFGCQGSDNGLAIEGGATLGWELAGQLADSGVQPDRVIIQIGGGALASATMQGLRDAVELGAMARLPMLHAVQTEGGWPLVRAYRAVVGRVAQFGPSEALSHASRHRSQYMWPWETPPRSTAHGILDDETYDWLAVVRALVGTGGSGLVVTEEELAAANQAGRAATGIDVDITGSAGLAGLLALAGRGEILPGEQVVVLFTGARRAARG